jgi:prepilin-type N-terminal cleavage/methylation domain-containing protein
MHRSLRSLGQAGFTLTEVLAASTLGLVALGAFTSFNITQMYGMRNQANQVDLQTSARSIADLFAREVRRAGGGTNVNCTGTVSTGLLTAQTSQVRVRLDLNGNGVLTDANEDVTYTLDFTNNQVTRTDNGARRTDTLWSGVSLAGSQISYFDGAGNQLAPGSTGLSAAQLLQVVRVRLQLALTAKVVEPRNTLQQTAMETTNITLRNRYFVMASTCAYR